METDNILKRLKEQSDDPFLEELFIETTSLSLQQSKLHNSILRQQHKLQELSYLNFPNLKHQIICFNGARIGRIITSQQTDATTLVDIRITPSFQGKGIGTSILQKLKDNASKTNSSILLKVDALGGLKKWYLALGFSQIQDYKIYCQLQFTPTTSTPI